MKEMDWWPCIISINFDFFKLFYLTGDFSTNAKTLKYSLTLGYHPTAVQGACSRVVFKSGHSHQLIMHCPNALQSPTWADADLDQCCCILCISVTRNASFSCMLTVEPIIVNHFLHAISDFCRLLITFANSIYIWVQSRIQTICNPIVFLADFFFKKLILKKSAG